MHSGTKIILIQKKKNLVIRLFIFPPPPHQPINIMVRLITIKVFKLRRSVGILTHLLERITAAFIAVSLPSSEYGSVGGNRYINIYTVCVYTYSNIIDLFTKETCRTEIPVYVPYGRPDRKLLTRFRCRYSRAGLSKEAATRRGNIPRYVLSTRHYL